MHLCEEIHANVNASVLNKTELEISLEEPAFNPNVWKELDILIWWKSNHQERFPILSRMATDILSVPITIVASEYAFSIGLRVFTKYRSSILPSNVCSGSYLYKELVTWIQI